MVKIMETQNYLVINEDLNVIENVIIWDGSPDNWTPPPNYIAIPQATTPALVWVPVIDLATKKTIDWTLQEMMGCAGVGFTWDGTYATTDQPKPEIPA